ncbi:hypothetical protein IV503_05595 [Klebsiella huaxiensis]|uniref:hypothetical protein n=1 Tax=Klebsiella huaxiensis TaxID=2153354 RepID=UPI002F2E3D67
MENAVLGSGIQSKKNLRICAGRCKIISTKSVLKKLTYQYLWDPDCLVFSPVDTSHKTQGNEPKCNQLLLFSVTVTMANGGQKKTCASAQAGVIRVVNLKSTPPINTSGITRISMP